MATTSHTVRIESGDFDGAALEVHRLRGTESISRPFSFDLELVGKSEPPPVSTLLGAPVCIVFERDGEAVRRVHGVVESVDDELDVRHDLYGVVVHVVPDAHLMTLVTTQEIFQHLTVPQIIEKKLAAVGLNTAAELRLWGTYPPRDFVVQFGETDLAFVSRLCEHLGISYFFDHGEHVTHMVFTDQTAGFGTPEDNELPYRGRGEPHDLFELRSVARLVPAQHVVMDYNYRTPRLDLFAQAEVSHGFGGGVIAYGDHFKTPEEGERIARIRAEEHDCRWRTYHGKSTRAELTSGCRYSVTGHPRLEDHELLVEQVEHEVVQAIAGIEPDGASIGYRNRFVAVPLTATYRPLRLTPKPRIAGVIQGIVQPSHGAALDSIGDFAQIDDWGRYVVKFLFDVPAGGEEKASKPVRMARPHVGPSHGMHFPLRPGVEIALAFVEGDPDRPIIVGALHNATTPDHITDKNPRLNQIRTGTGVQITIQDARGGRE